MIAILKKQLTILERFCRFGDEFYNFFQLPTAPSSTMLLLDLLLSRLPAMTYFLSPPQLAAAAQHW
jgi:hypothetical protein